MRVVVQRVDKSSVVINNEVYNEINKGLFILVGFTENDTSEDIDYVVKKVVNLRIFDDENGIMNKSVIDENGEILSISQFTLYASTAKGNRPSYIRALNGELSTKLYDEFNNKLNQYVPCKTGVFGADMICHIENNGPVTIIIDSKDKNL